MRISVFFISALLLLQGGCEVIVGPTDDEKKIPAEYDLTGQKGQKILVLVNQPTSLETQVNLCYYLTEAINANLAKNIGVPMENLISYSKLSEFRSVQPDFQMHGPAAEVGRALDVNMVLSVRIEDYQLNEMPESGYYKGFIVVRAAFIDTVSGEQLWPKSGTGKSVKVGFEVETRGQDAAVGRLAASCAGCITRYFYNCPLKKFKIADDRGKVGWEDWN